MYTQLNSRCICVHVPTAIFVDVRVGGKCYLLFAITFHVYTKAAPCVYAMEVMLGENIHVHCVVSPRRIAVCVCAIEEFPLYLATHCVLTTFSRLSSTSQPGLTTEYQTMLHPSWPSTGGW